MPRPTPLATAEEIHAHLVDQLNLALRRPGMFGGEVAIRVLLDQLLFVERQPEAFAQQRQVWEDRGLWSALGLNGVFRDLIPGGCEYGIVSVYAEFAQQRGWLKPDAVLAEAAYESLKRRARGWAGEDRTWGDVTAEFGAPSVLFGGNNPRYGKSLGYLSADLTQPMVVFHLWNGSKPETEPWLPEYEQPVLLAVRFGGGPLPRTLTFTPEGQRRKPAADEECRPAGG